MMYTTRTLAALILTAQVFPSLAAALQKRTADFFQPALGGGSMLDNGNFLSLGIFNFAQV